MLDFGLNLIPDKMLNVVSGGLINYPPSILPTPNLHPLPDTNTRLVAISESDLALILAFLDESMAEYMPINCVVVQDGTRRVVFPNMVTYDLKTGDRVNIGTFLRRLVLYSGSVDEYDAYPDTKNKARRLLRERLAIVRERLMVDLTGLLTTINASLALIEEHAERQADAQERIATAVETQVTEDGLGEIADNLALLLPLVAAV